MVLALLWCSTWLARSNVEQRAHSTSSEVALPSRYVLHSWTSANGLPASAIQCLLQSHQGYLWIGTRNGLVRFDGERFVRLVDVNCRCLAEDSQGTLWVGSMTGLLRWKDGDLERVARTSPKAKSTYSFSVFSMCPCPTGGVWFCDGDGLFRATQSSLVQVAPVDSHGFVYDMRYFGGRLWLATDAGLELWNPGSTNLPYSVAAPGSSRCVTVDNSGAIWFGGKQVVRCLALGGAGERSQTSYTNDVRPRDDWVSSVVQDPEDKIWVGANSGLWQAADGWLAQPLSIDGAVFGAINCLLLDREGRLFVGTESHGLFCLDRPQFTTYSTEDGLVNDSVWTIAASHDASLWIGTDGGITRLMPPRLVKGNLALKRGHETDSHPNPSGFQHREEEKVPREDYGTNEGLVTLHVRSVLEDRSGTLWAATASDPKAFVSGALHRLHNGKFVALGPGEGITSRDFSCIYEDHKDNLWVAGDDNMYQWANGSMSIVRPRRTPGTGEWIFVDHNGNVWLGGAEVDCLHEGRLVRYDVQRLVGPGVYAVVHEDERGALWLASSQHGLVRLKDGQFRAITTAQGLFSDQILSLQEDQAGNYWMNSHNGIFRADERDLNMVADGQQGSVQCVSYGLEDGLLSVEANGGTLPNSCKTADGRLWFPTTKGVAVVDPAQTASDALPPSVIIESVRADGRTYYKNSLAAIAQAADRRLSWQAPGYLKTPPRSYSGRNAGNEVLQQLQLRLPSGRGRSLEFEFSAPTLVHSDRVHFKYRLPGRDKDWIDIGTQRFVALEDLPPGRYRFNVTACSRHGVWNQTGAEFAFALAPFFYQTWTFYGLCAMGAVLAVAGLQAYRLALQRRYLKLEHEAAMANERERIARDMHDDLGASLTRIALMTEVARKQLPDQHPASISMDHVSNIARQVVDGISELIWVANPHFDTLVNLVAYLREYASGFCASGGFECKLQFPVAVPHRALPSDFRRQIFLVLKEALNNVQRHSGATRVDVQLALAEDRIELTVSDNGRGFTVQHSPSSGHGLANMQQRANALGGTCNITSDPGRGTTLQFLVLLPPSS